MSKMPAIYNGTPKATEIRKDSLIRTLRDIGIITTQQWNTLFDTSSLKLHVRFK